MPSFPPLDPRQTGAPKGEWQPNFHLEPRVREFGFFPDVAQLRPGDLILTQDLAPDAVSRAIRNSQVQAGFTAAHSEWTHAAMYLGDGEQLVEATFDWNKSGVQVAPLGNYVGSHLLRFRRPLDLSDEQRWLMVVEAVSYVRRGYNFKSLIPAWLRMRRGFWRSGPKLPQPDKIDRAFVCSTLYARAFSRISGWAIDRRVDVHVPATLSQAPLLEDVQVGWMRIAN